MLPLANLDPRVDRALSQTARDGRASWPGVELSLVDLAAHVRRVAATPDDLSRYGADLYLACACALGDDTAIRLFESSLMPGVEAHVARLVESQTAREEVCQQLRVTALTGPHPDIAVYAARGPLVGWLKTAAARIALKLATRPSVAERGLGAEAAIARLVSEMPDPEIVALRSRFANQIQLGLAASLESLEPRARRVLRMHYGEGLNIDAIAAVFRVHRATVARWLLAIRDTVVAQLRQHVRVTPPPTSSEFRSLIGAVRDDLHISVDRVLGSRGNEP